ncbi:hypothetical protein BBP40_002218 [Aspergillus hancockii]|nr:hypothetical protein BBP40_002218 [Aspergillus hancockii]
MISSPTSVMGPISPPLIPGCDGAGVVEAIGCSVAEFSPGDRVVIHLAPKLVESKGDDAPVGIADAGLALGQGTDGTLRSHGVFLDTGLVHAPKSLGCLPAATLTCTWLAAWNALFGVKGREAGPGPWVLVQGTGGVSIAVLQLAVAAGATVVATTSTAEKATRLLSLGATHVVNYRRNPERWGEETLSQSLAAVRNDGLVVVGGMVGQSTEPVPLLEALLHTCVVRGILAGSRNQFQDVIRFIDEKRIVPAIDDVVFELSEVKGAYRRLQAMEHFSKVMIRVHHAEAETETRLCLE